MDLEIINDLEMEFLPISLETGADIAFRSHLTDEIYDMRKGTGSSVMRKLTTSSSMRRTSTFSQDANRLRRLSNSDGLLILRKKSVWARVSAASMSSNNANSKEKTTQDPSVKKRKHGIIPFTHLRTDILKLLSHSKKKNSVKGNWSDREITKSLPTKNYLLRGAVRRLDIERVKKLLSSEDVDINESNDRGITVLHEAAIDGNHACVKLLTENGADINQTDNEGFNAVDYAVCGGDFETASFLISQGANETRIRNGLIGINNK